ncbi:glycosyltransferase family 2 protein [Pseudomonas mandelii]|uniref:glycosyltransferase family 2 protein n=1 Tax=Pseudomonas mandelii TaxID=75612 RepID=UPI00209D636D|nr:glycosyltransferase family 2 protein [Pseudomonas mandelii]MCO8312162.1 glycosyltransferase family 2 protein [Pseudomonas mandelii]
MNRKKLISIVVPFFNEGGNVKFFQASIGSLIETLPDFDFEIVCVDDGSQDNTLQNLVSIASTDQQFKIIELSRNFGKEAALTAGIDHASGDAVIPIDADLQDPPELIEQMLTEWQKGYEVVLARRVDRSSDSYLKRRTAELFYKFHNRLSHVKIPENVGDFRLMDRKVVEAVKLLPEQQRFMKGLFAWVGYSTTTVDYVRSARVAGDSKFSGWKLWNFALEGITSFSSAPLKLWTYLGGVGAALSLIYASYIIFRTLIYGVDLPGYASILVAVLFVGSLQLMSIGMLGEYVGRIYIESKRRPVYLIRNTYSKKYIETPTKNSLGRV